MQGLVAVYQKELADHFNSYRFIILFALIGMVSLITSYMAGVYLNKELAGKAVPKFVFLLLFSRTGALFSLVQFVAFFGPLIGLLMGFDTINRERAHGTLIKLISQPIHRDAVLNGKFLAGLTMITILLISIVLVVTGFGLTILGIIPGAEEISRLVIFLIISIFYIAFWLALAILFSLIFKGIATSALAVIAVWIFLSFFISYGVEVVADSIIPVDESNKMSVIDNLRFKNAVSRISPMVVYSEASDVIIEPMKKTTEKFRESLMGPMEYYSMSRFQGPLPLGQSIIIIYPHLIALIAFTMICFAVSYLIFMLQEIRT